METNAKDRTKTKGCLYPFALLGAQTLKPHERVKEPHLNRLVREIREDGMLRCPVLVDRNSFVILDGHHRVLALKRLECGVIPSYLVDYRDPGVEVTVWEPATVKITKESILNAALSGNLYPPKTSKHVWPARFGEHPVPIEVLRLPFFNWPFT